MKLDELIDLLSSRQYQESKGIDSSSLGAGIPLADSAYSQRSTKEYATRVVIDQFKYQLQDYVRMIIPQMNNLISYIALPITPEKSKEVAESAVQLAIDMLIAQESVSMQLEIGMLNKESHLRAVPAKGTLSPTELELELHTQAQRDAHDHEIAARNADKSDGYRPSVCILDEIKEELE